MFHLKKIPKKFIRLRSCPKKKILFFLKCLLSLFLFFVFLLHKCLKLERVAIARRATVTTAVRPRPKILLNLPNPRLHLFLKSSSFKKLLSSRERLQRKHFSSFTSRPNGEKQLSISLLTRCSSIRSSNHFSNKLLQQA